MPGRPKTIAREITEVEDVVLHLAMHMFARIPPQYRQRPDPADALNAAWNEAVRATLLASARLETLGDLLRARAGITEPSPAAIARAEWEARAKAGGGTGAAPGGKQLGEPLGQKRLAEENGRVAVVHRSSSGQDFPQVGCEDRRIEAPLADVLVRRNDLPPGFQRAHRDLLPSQAAASSPPAAARSRRFFSSESLRGPCRNRPMDVARSPPAGRRM